MWGWGAEDKAGLQCHQLHAEDGLALVPMALVPVLYIKGLGLKFKKLFMVLDGGGWGTMFGFNQYGTWIQPISIWIQSCHSWIQPGRTGCLVHYCFAPKETCPQTSNLNDATMTDHNHH